MSFWQAFNDSATLSATVEGLSSIAAFAVISEAALSMEVQLFTVWCKKNPRVLALRGGPPATMISGVFSAYAQATALKAFKRPGP
jgi:hypothetical protein